MDKIIKLQKQREATRRWRERHPKEWIESQKRAEAKRKGINRYNTETRKAWYIRKKQDKEWVNRVREQSNERKHKIIQFLNEYKLQKGCQDCGYKQYAVALDFDHINGTKELNVCNSKSITQAMKEIKKCEVVCSNCHRVRTMKRLYPCKPDIFKMTYEEV